MKTIALALLLIASLTTTACTHHMRVKNLDDYTRAAPALGDGVSIVLEDRSATPAEHEYFAFVHEALAVTPGVRVVLASDEAPAGFAPDVRVSVRPRGEYRGSAWNYLITFPGFVLFTHAWNGFVYEVDLATEVGIDDGPSTTIPTAYRLRHCDFERGAWTSSGWYTPGWGGLNAIIGFFMVPYDEDSTPEFQKEVRTAYGRYIAASILELVERRPETHVSRRNRTRA